MKATLTQGKENIVDMEIVIPAKEAANAYDRTLNEINQSITIDGFRKGKAPKNLIEKRVGTEKIKIDTIEHVSSKYISKAIEENDLDIIVQPAITSYDFEIGKDLVLKVRVETRPEVKLGQYKDLKLKVEDSPVTPDAEEKTVESLLNQKATMESITNRPAKDTDIAVIDFDGTSNGEKIIGGEGKNYSLDLGHSNFIKGFAEQIVGRKVGEEFDIEVTFPKDYQDEKLKGQPATFKIKLHEIKEKHLPELNDEFVKQISSFKTVDELKEDIKKHLSEQREQINKRNSESEIFKTIVESAKIDIPQSMIDRELQMIKEDYKQRLSYQGIAWDNLIKAQGGEDKLNETLTEDAINRIKNSLVIEKIAKIENLKVEMKDFQEKLTQMAAMYGMKVQDLLKNYGSSPELLASVSQQAMTDKVRDYLVKNNNVEIVAKKG